MKFPDEAISESRVRAGPDRRGEALVLLIRPYLNIIAITGNLFPNYVTVNFKISP
jgi:hypothetical protein